MTFVGFGVLMCDVRFVAVEPDISSFECVQGP